MTKEPNESAEVSFPAVGDLGRLKHVVIYGDETQEGTWYEYINMETGESIEGISPPFDDIVDDEGE